MTDRARAATLAALAALAVAAAATAWLVTTRRATAPAGPTTRSIATPATSRPTWLGERIIATSTLVGETLTISPVGAPPLEVSLAGRGALAPTGAPVVPLAGGWLVPLSRPSAPRDALLIVDSSSQARVVELTSSERVVTAQAGAPPTLVLTGAGDGGAVAFVRATVRSDGGLDERERATVPYTPSLVLEPTPELRCGVSGERFTPLLAQTPAGGVLLAVADDRMYPLRFRRGPSAVVTPVCGPCPPLALSRDGDEVTLLVNVGRKLAASAVAVPARPVHDAAGVCTGTSTVVALAAGDALWAVTSSDGSWRLDSPAQLAGSTSDGAPRDLALALVNDALELSFRRERARSPERLTSRDGGRTWR